MVAPMPHDDEDFRQWQRFKAFEAAQAAGENERPLGELHREWLPRVRIASRAMRASQGRHLYRKFPYRGKEIALSDLKPSECTHDVLTTWLAFLGETKAWDRGPLSPGTVDGIRVGIQAMFTHYVGTGELRSNPWRKIPRDKRRHRQREGYLTFEDTERHAALMPLVGGYILRHCFATGCRQGNIRELEKSHIDWRLRHLLLVTKGDNQQRVIVPPSILDEMRHLCALSPSKWVYPNPPDPTKAVPHTTIWQWLGRACKALGCNPKHVMHETRHGQALALLEQGASLPMVQRRLGHSNIEQTARYSRMRDKMLDVLAEIADRTIKPKDEPPKK